MDTIFGPKAKGLMRDFDLGCSLWYNSYALSASQMVLPSVKTSTVNKIDKSS
jgi:hypothetical protein